MALNGAGPEIAAAMAAVAVFAAIYVAVKGGSGDPLETLAKWARTRGLEYVAPISAEVVATFARELDGVSSQVTVSRVGRRIGDDLPTRLTTTRAFVGGALPHSESVPGDFLCTVQPAEWVLDREGHRVGETVPSGDPAFDSTWAVRGADAAAVIAVLRPAVRSRLMEPDAKGLIVEIASGSVAIPMPGVCSDPRELDRRLAVATSIAKALA